MLKLIGSENIGLYSQQIVKPVIFSGKVFVWEHPALWSFFFWWGEGGRGGGSGTKNLNILLAYLSSIVKTQPLFMYNVRVNSNREHPPQANPGHLFYDESRGPGIWQLEVSRPPGHLQTITNLFRNIPSSFPTALRVKGFKQSNMVILE